MKPVKIMTKCALHHGLDNKCRETAEMDTNKNKTCIASLLMLAAVVLQATSVFVSPAIPAVSAIMALAGLGCMFFALAAFESKLNVLLDIKDCAERLSMRAAATASTMKSIEACIGTLKSQSEAMAKQNIDLDFSVREAAKVLEDRQNAVLASLSNIDRHLCNGLNGVLDYMGAQQDASQEKTAV